MRSRPTSIFMSKGLIRAVEWIWIHSFNTVQNYRISRTTTAVRVWEKCGKCPNINPGALLWNLNSIFHEFFSFFFDTFPKTVVFFYVSLPKIIVAFYIESSINFHRALRNRTKKKWTK